jgi:hypothetical protein
MASWSVSFYDADNFLDDSAISIISDGVYYGFTSFFAKSLTPNVCRKTWALVEWMKGSELPPPPLRAISGKRRSGGVPAYRLRRRDRRWP